VSRARIASAFFVREQRVARFERFDSLTAALCSVQLHEHDEVRDRS
jgi:hypothetical protein